MKNKNKKSQTHTNNNTNTTNNANKSSKNNAKANKRIKNWQKYGLALGKRGDVIALLDMAEARGAFSQPSYQKQGMGRPREYSDELIVLILIIHELFHQPLRQAISFVFGIMVSHKKYVKLPNYSTVSRRAAELEIDILPDDYDFSVFDSFSYLVDGSGFNVHGEGNWFRHKHGFHAARGWQETHIGMHSESRMILAITNTPNNVHDTTQFLPLVEAGANVLKRLGIADKLGDILGDGAYETKTNYKLAKQYGKKLIAPPRKGAVWHYKLRSGELIDDPGWEDRNKVLRQINQCGGIEEWKKRVNYHRRSLVENAFYRIKTIFGDKMTFRTIKNRNVEQLIRVKILNLFTSFGLPEY